MERFLNLRELTYRNDSVQILSQEELSECARLFSENYGLYRAESPIRPGQQIKMSETYYKKNYCRDDYYVARAFYKDTLIGQAFYVRISVEGDRYITWVVQLVVDKDYRGNHIGSTLLNSIWCFSDDIAWGLATANPCTIKALEAATLRRCEVKEIGKRIALIDQIRELIPFAKDADLRLSEQEAIIQSKFFVDNSQYGNIEEIEKKLGVLEPGDEWLCFTFFDQRLDKELCRKYMDTFFESSKEQVYSAYDRMPMQTHAWTKGTENEVSFILDWMRGNGQTERGKIDSVLDLGCGDGRHLKALASQIGYGIGVDSSKTHIENADNNRPRNLGFFNEDAGDLQFANKFSAVLCLYDVYGSFARNSENDRILETAYSNLEKGGYLFLSAMNKDLTLNLLPQTQYFDLQESPEKPIYLKPGKIMQESGNIFDPAYLLYDEHMDIFYHKEQFDNDCGLRAEYVIRDRRYTAEELEQALQTIGFSVQYVAYVQAGHFDLPLDKLDQKAKEILVVARK